MKVKWQVKILQILKSKRDCLAKINHLQIIKRLSFEEQIIKYTI